MSSTGLVVGAQQQQIVVALGLPTIIVIETGDSRTCPGGAWEEINRTVIYRPDQQSKNLNHQQQQQQQQQKQQQQQLGGQMQPPQKQQLQQQNNAGKKKPLAQHPRSTRVQRRIDASKAKISTFAAIAKIQTNLHRNNSHNSNNNNNNNNIIAPNAKPALPTPPQEKGNMASATNGNGNNNNNNASSGPAPRKGGGGAKKKAGGGASGKKPFKKQQSNPTLRPKPAKGTAGGARSKTRPPSESEDEDHAPLQRVVPAAPPQQDSLPARSILDDMDLFGPAAAEEFRPVLSAEEMRKLSLINEEEPPMECLPVPPPPPEEPEAKGYDSDEELERIKQQIVQNLKKRDPVLDRKRCELVVKAFQNHVNSKRPAKLPNKWHVWKYVEADQRRKAVQFDWMKMGRDTSEEVGWGRRIYEKTEIENDDKERERQLFNDEEVRHLNMKKKEVKNKYGLWDNVYDKRIIRTLDTNTKWAPSKKENEKRAKVKQKKQLKEKKKTNSTGGDEADAEADDEGSEKSNGGPQPGSGDESVDWDEDDAFSDSKKKWIPTGKTKRKGDEDAKKGERLTKEDLVFCEEHTNFSEEAIKRWFNHFREECPTGKLTKEHLHSLFQKIFPVGESETFCNHIFRIFDNDGNGFLDFKEFLMALDVTQCRSEREKLQWAFRLYDVDASGSINLKEITTIMETMDQVEGRGDILVQDSSGGLKTVAKRADEIFGMLDVDHDGEITMDEFVEGYLRIHSLDTRSGPPEKSQGTKKPLGAIGKRQPSSGSLLRRSQN